MKIGVDASWMVGNYRGMGRFAHQLIKPIKESIVAFTPNDVGFDGYNYVSSGRAFFPWWEQLVLPRLCRDEKIDYLLCPYNSGPLAPLGGARIISVIHDLIYLLPWLDLPPSRSIYQTLGRGYRRKIVPKFVRKADVILTVSQHTKFEIIRQLDVSEEIIRVIPNSIAEEWFSTPIPMTQRKPYLFTVAGEAPSKNVYRLIEAFSIALLSIGPKYRLVVAGIKEEQHGAFIKIAEKFNISALVDFLGFITEEELKVLYREAQGFVFASLFEGFGIPILEAMASGTPIACSNTSPISELVDDFAFLFDPRSVYEITKQIINLLDESTRCDNLIISAIDRASSFSEKVISKTIEEFWISLI